MQLPEGVRPVNPERDAVIATVVAAKMEEDEPAETADVTAAKSEEDSKKSA